MEYIIGGLIIILILYITGFLIKRKYYKEVDRLESWKIDIMNRPILEEMSKVKQLNMTGQTEELFEKWRNEWDDIVATQLPDVEDYLFDAEDFIDKYRFKKAKEILNAIKEHLTETEDNLKGLLNEINDLVGSEEQSRKEIEELKDMYRVGKKMLLAHRHNYGIAEAKLEQRFDEVAEHFLQFDERTENGDYLKARETVLVIKSLLIDLNNKMDVIPDLLVECQSKIPSQLREVNEGYREMLQQGYILDHIQLSKEIEKVEKELGVYVSYLENLETEEVEKGIVEISESIDMIYKLLEEEVHARKFLQDHEAMTRKLLLESREENDAVKAELQSIMQSYHVSKDKVEEQNHLEKNLNQLVKRYELLEHKIHSDEIAHSILERELTEIKKELEKVERGFASFSEQMQALRKDELEAREKVVILSRKIAEAIRTVSNNNIPGLSKEYEYLLVDAKESIVNVKRKLEERPLDIPTVKQYLEIAEMTVDKTYELAIEIVETVTLVEKVIQYGNRYRSQYLSIDKGLKEAELSFRNYDYQTALEQAATCIEEVDPGALKKIEALLQEEEVFK